MLAHALFSTDQMNENDFFIKIQAELINRYGVDTKLASEMTWDFIEVLSAVDGDINMFEKYFLQ